MDNATSHCIALDLDCAFARRSFNYNCSSCRSPPIASWSTFKRRKCSHSKLDSDPEHYWRRRRRYTVGGSRKFIERQVYKQRRNRPLLANQPSSRKPNSSRKWPSVEYAILCGFDYGAGRVGGPAVGGRRPLCVPLGGDNQKPIEPIGFLVEDPQIFGTRSGGRRSEKCVANGRAH